MSAAEDSGGAAGTGAGGGGGTGTGAGAGWERYVPGVLTLENGAEKLREAEPRIRAGASLVMDMAESGDCDSAALGAMIEWRRLAAERKCDLRFENIGGRLAKLARLYQVAELFGVGKEEDGDGAAKSGA